MDNLAQFLTYFAEAWAGYRFSVSHLWILVAGLVLLRILQGALEPSVPTEALDHEYGPPTAEELAEIEDLKQPGSFRVDAKRSVVAYHFFTDTDRLRSTSRGTRMNLDVDSPMVVRSWQGDPGRGGD